MLSPTAVTSPLCPVCATTLLLCRAYSINPQELVFHHDHVPLQGPVPGIHPEDVDDSLNAGITSTTVDGSILQLPRKLWHNYSEK